MFTNTRVDKSGSDVSKLYFIPYEMIIYLNMFDVSKYSHGPHSKLMHMSHEDKIGLSQVWDGKFNNTT